MVEGVIEQNMVMMSYGTDNVVSVYNLAGYVHYVYDASAVVLSD
jgi:hypothetical protein